MDDAGRLVDAQGRTLDYLRERRRAYQLCFGSPAGQEVLLDLISFCRGAETVWDDDPRKHAVLTGRNEVWTRIQQHLNLQPSQLFQLYAGQPLLIPKED